MRTKEAIGIVVGALVLLVVTIATLNRNKTHQKVENSRSTAISAVELGAAYQQNERWANAHYLNHALEVSGNIAGVERNQNGENMVLLESISPDIPVQCTMRQAEKPLPVGSRVKLKGLCTGSNLSGVTLTDCIVAAN
jgi:hypothetical protein